VSAEMFEWTLNEDCENNKLTPCSYRLNVDGEERCRRGQVGLAGKNLTNAVSTGIYRGHKLGYCAEGSLT
jgi:hypothetical protein